MTHPERSSEALEALIAAAKNGDSVSLGLLASRYRDYLKFLARSQLHHHIQAKTDASDIAQEVSLVAHERISEFRGHSAEEFAGWLRGILANQIAMHVRRYLGTQKRDLRLEQALDRGLTSASGFLQRGLEANVSSPSQHVLKNEASLELAEAIEGLPDHYKEVIVLRHLDSLPFAEIARRMERSVDSVEKLWVRALAKLRARLS